MKDSEPGNAGLPYQLGILHILPFYFSYLCLLSLASVKDSDPGNAGLPYQLGILHILPFYFSYLCLLSLASVKDSDPGNAGLPYQLGILHILPFYFSYLCLLSLASVKDSDPGNAGLPYQLGILHILPFYFSHLCLLSLAFVKDSEPGNAGLPYQLGILHILPFYFSYHFLTLSHSGKCPCIRHTKVQWEVGTRYINPIRPYSFSRQLYLSYQDRLSTIIQLEIVRMAIWFPCWGPVWSKGWDINAMLLFFYSTAPRTSCLVARYHRPFEARSANSTRRETFQKLAACSSSPHAGWFAPLSVPPGSPAALAPVSEPLGSVKPRETRKTMRQ